VGSVWPCRGKRGIDCIPRTASSHRRYSTAVPRIPRSPAACDAESYPDDEQHPGAAGHGRPASAPLPAASPPGASPSAAAIPPLPRPVRPWLPSLGSWTCQTSAQPRSAPLRASQWHANAAFAHRGAFWAGPGAAALPRKVILPTSTSGDPLAGFERDVASEDEDEVGADGPVSKDGGREPLQSIDERADVRASYLNPLAQALRPPRLAS